MPRFLATRFFSAAFAFTVALTAHAAEPKPADRIDQDLLEQLRDQQRMIEAVSGAQKDVKLEVPLRYRAEAEKFAAEANRIQADAIRKQAIANGQYSEGAEDPYIQNNPETERRNFFKKHDTIIFASFSMPEKVLLDIMKEAARENVAVLFRGLHPKDRTITDTALRLSDICQEADAIGVAALNPVPFQEFKVKVVPTVIRVGKNGTQEIGRVEGNFNLSYFDRELDDRIKHQEGTNLGRKGQVWEIAERDFTEEIQRRIAQIDWASKVEAAKDRYWKNHARSVDLPTSRKHSIRRVDPTVMMTKDVTMPGDPSKVIVRAGQTMNPLDHVPLTKRMVIFDPTQPRQLTAVKEYLAQQKDGRKLVIMATRMDGERGWKGYENLTIELNNHVYMLQKEMVGMLRLRAIPSMITAEGSNLVIEELEIPL